MNNKQIHILNNIKSYLEHATDKRGKELHNNLISEILDRLKELKQDNVLVLDENTFVGQVYEIQNYFKQTITLLAQSENDDFEDKASSTGLIYELLGELYNDIKNEIIEEEDLIKVSYNPMGTYFYTKLIEENEE